MTTDKTEKEKLVTLSKGKTTVRCMIYTSLLL